MTAALSGQRRRIYVDLAVISRHDAGTGIQRVVCALALALVEVPAERWDVRFVAADRRFPITLLHGLGRIRWSSERRSRRPGDVFIGLDFRSTPYVSSSATRPFSARWGSLWFPVCDLLPAERPEWFSANNVIRYKAWLEIIAGIADGFLCISQQTEDDLRRVLADRFGLEEGYATSIVPMGHAIMDPYCRKLRRQHHRPPVST
jgi:hypothetical protein